jgi:hypothetical protein
VTERSTFLNALDREDPAARAAYLDARQRFVREAQAVAALPGEDQL